MQRIIYEKGQMWSWKRTVPYRIVGAIFLLMGTAGSLKAYTSSKEDEARTELERITVLTGLPETQPPSREMSSRMLMIIVVVALLLPILILGLFLIFRAVG